MADRLGQGQVAQEVRQVVGEYVQLQWGSIYKEAVGVSRFGEKSFSIVVSSTTAANLGSSGFASFRASNSILSAAAFCPGSLAANIRTGRTGITSAAAKLEGMAVSENHNSLTCLLGSARPQPLIPSAFRNI